MKILRSSKCTLKFSTQSKQDELAKLLAEYGRVVNCYIDLFWDYCPSKRELMKAVLSQVNTRLSYRLKQVAAREAVDMIKSVKKRSDKGSKPVHSGKGLKDGGAIAHLVVSKKATEYDCWLHLASVGEKLVLDLPIKLHRQFNMLAERGKRLNSYIITNDYVQFCFEIETGPKKSPDNCVGIDTGIKSLASLSDGRQIGKDLEKYIDRIRRCKHGSKGQRRAAKTLRYYMDIIAKEVVSDADLVVVENLKNITKNTKRRALGRKTRAVIGRWNVRYWLETLQRKCEDNRVAFRSVSPYQTSQTCSSCSHVDKKNRDGEMFLCLNCGYTDNADINAAKNILSRFITGKYGSGCKAKS